jgi:phosphatidate cytidylyltransferase
MKQRVVSALILIIAIILPLIFFKLHAGICIFTILAIFSQYELYQLLEKIGPSPPHYVLGLILGASIIPGAYYLNNGFEIISLAVIICTTSLLIIKKKIESFLYTLFGIFYVPFMLQFFIYLPDLTENQLQGLFLGIWLALTVKINDGGAFFLGTKFGKTKMAPKISPKKTWEGALGGVLTSMVVGSLFVVLFQKYLPESFSPWQAVLVSIPIAITGTISDLIESLLKRQAKVKDSGKVIPGIGGILDMTDSLILTAPLGYFIFLLIL